MLHPMIVPLVIAAAIGLCIGVERTWRGFAGSAPFHVAPALVGAFLVERQTGLIALFWFLPLQILMWLIVGATVCMWSAERTPDAAGDFRGSGGLGLSWSLCFLLGVACAFHAWFLLAGACAMLLAFGLRTPRRVTAPAVSASAPAAQALEQGGSGEAISGNEAHVDLPGVDGEAGGATEPAIDGTVVEAERAQALLQRPAA